MYLKIALNNKVAITDTILEMLTINPQTLGISSFMWNKTDLVGASDGGQGIVNGALTTAGLFSTRDVCMKGDATSMAARSSIVFHITLTLNYTYMLDSACNKFYWQRTA